MLTMSAREEDLAEAIKSGASGYLLKGLAAEELVAGRGDHRHEAPFAWAKATLPSSVAGEAEAPPVPSRAAYW